MSNRSFLFKIVLIGDSGVGKTNLVTRFSTNVFNAETTSTIGVEFMTKDMTIDGVDLKAQIWDTAGQERFRAISRTMYQGSKGAMVVYDITRQSTFDNVSKWLNELVAFTPSSTALMLVGNKCDLEHMREVKTEVAQKFAENHNLLFLETSALDATNVEKAFEVLMTEVLKTALNPHVTTSDRQLPVEGHGISLTPSPPPLAPDHKQCACKA